MTGLLASVRNVDEACIACAGGADIVDLKDPARGALGAVAPSVLRAVCRRLRGRCLLSATAGDVPMAVEPLRRALERTAGGGVDLVKIGLPRLDRHRDCLRALHAAARAGVRVVAVLFAEQTPPLWLVDELAAAGCHGVMLDTADKNAGGLLRHRTPAQLDAFLLRARRHGLLNALAGSLAPGDIAALLPLAPDYLGFRGALCERGARTAALSPQAVRRLRDAIPHARTDFRQRVLTRAGQARGSRDARSTPRGTHTLSMTSGSPLSTCGMSSH